MRTVYNSTAVALLAILLTLPMLGAAPPNAKADNLTLLQQLFVLKEMKPDVKRIGVLSREDISNREQQLEKLKRAQSATKVEVIVSYVGSIQEVGPKFRQLANKHDIDALWILENDGLIDSDVSRSFLIENAAKQGIPILAPTKDWVSAGPCVMFRKGENGIQILANKSTTSAMALSIPKKYEKEAQIL